jgi:predicted N-acyltransferase
MTKSESTMTTKLRFEYHKSIGDIPSEAWNKLAEGRGPFICHEFLYALEVAACANADTGWDPHHLTVWGVNAQGVETLLAAMPLYLKYHSYGEYVFDWSWADAYHHNGVQYYPKFLTAIPFTPSYGSRILVERSCDQAEIEKQVVEGVLSEARRLGVSSWHVLFPEQKISNTLALSGIHQRLGTQFHWFNRGYQNFDHFLEGFASRKRKNIRKERLRVAQEGIEFSRIEGADISDELWQQFFEFYLHTYQIRGQQGYLTQEFFMNLSQSMPNNLLLVVAHKKEKNIAAALSFRDDKKLYGRYWGCLEEYQFLHFETCYYQGIEYAIEKGLQSFDSGAQGEHKIQRGFEPITTYSNHWIEDHRFEVAIKNFLVDESSYSAEYRASAKQMLPFKKLEPES